MVGDNLEDYVADAGKLTVVEGDYFGTGKLPPRDAGDFVVAHDWTVLPERDQSSDPESGSALGDLTRFEPAI
jgi:hypothetical protein